jgi:hypothetical protein
VGHTANALVVVVFVSICDALYVGGNMTSECVFSSPTIAYHLQRAQAKLRALAAGKAWQTVLAFYLFLRMVAAHASP